MQRIEIENFGPIKNVAFDIKDYTVFIGPQASGKSTIARAVYFFRTLDEELCSAISLSAPDCRKEEIISTFKESITRKALTIWDTVFWSSKAMLRFHYNDDLSITISQAESGEILISLTSGWNELFSRVEHILHHVQNEQGEKLIKIYDAPLLRGIAGQLVSNLFPFPNGRPAFIPAGRILFSCVEDNLISREQELADVLVARFFDFCKFVKRKYKLQMKLVLHSRKKIDSSTIDKIFSLSRAILGGTIEFTNDKCHLSLPSQEGLIQIADASSGQQEAVWILLYVMYHCYLDVAGFFTVIEEPEAHLFPNAQRNMMYLLTLLANQSENQLMLTTHSPYILTPLNNLLLAHHVGQSKRETVGQIVDPDLWIDPERFECYYVDYGTISSVMDRNTGMIDLAGLDAVSSTLNDQYDQLAALED